MIDVSSSIEAAAKASSEAVKAIDAIVGLPMKVKEAYREIRLDGVVSKLNERLYGRYQLIYAVENFGRMKDPEHDLAAIVKTALDRAEYLRDFNKDVEPRLRAVEPKLAANLVALTRESIKLYEELAAINDTDSMARFAPTLANALKDIAEYLEGVNSRLKERILRP